MTTGAGANEAHSCGVTADSDHLRDGTVQMAGTVNAPRGILRLAVAQTEVSGEVPNEELLSAAGGRIRSQIVEAAKAGARLVQFPEGTLAYRHKRLISSASPDLSEADWTKVDWPALRRELEAIADCAAESGIWAVVGAPHPLSAGRRPHNSLYVFSDHGELVTRYDKRRLSMTEVTYMYTPGTDPIVFEVDEFRFGSVLCLETLFPELFVEYAAMDVDAVLLSSAPSSTFGPLAQAHAVMNVISVAVAYATSEDAHDSRSGICSLHGWVAQSADGSASITVADIPRSPSAPTFHRQARDGLYDDRMAPRDPRSINRQVL